MQLVGEDNRGCERMVRVPVSVCACMSSPLHLLQLQNTRKHKRDADLFRDKNKTNQKRICLHLFVSTIPTYFKRNVIFCISNQLARRQQAEGRRHNQRQRPSRRKQEVMPSAGRKSSSFFTFIRAARWLLLEQDGAAVPARFMAVTGIEKISHLRNLPRFQSLAFLFLFSVRQEPVCQFAALEFRGNFGCWRRLNGFGVADRPHRG